MRIRGIPPVIPFGAPFIATIWMVETEPFSQKAFETRKDSTLCRDQTLCGRWSTEVTIFDSHITEAGKEAARMNLAKALLVKSQTIRQIHFFIFDREGTSGGHSLNRTRRVRAVLMTCRSTRITITIRTGTNIRSLGLRGAIKGSRLTRRPWAWHFCRKQNCPTGSGTRPPSRTTVPGIELVRPGIRSSSFRGRVSSGRVTKLIWSLDGSTNNPNESGADRSTSSLRLTVNRFLSQMTIAAQFTN